MSKYGFDFCVKQIGVINEMARASHWKQMSQGAHGVKDPEFYSRFESIYNKIKSIFDTKISKTLSRGKVIDYIARNIIEESDEQYPDFGTYKIEKTKAGRGKYNPTFLKWLERTGYKYSDQKAQEYALNLLLEDNKDLILNNDFIEALTSEERVDSYLEDRMVPMTSSFATGKAKEKEEMHGAEFKDIQNILAKGSELSKKINKLMRKVKKGKNVEELEGEELKNLTPDYYYAESIAEELSYIGEHLSDEQAENGSGVWGVNQGDDNPSSPEEWRKYFAERISVDEFEELEGFFEERMDSGTGLNPEMMDKVIKGLSQKSPELAQLGEYLKSVASSERGEMNYESEQYPGYDNRVLAKVLDTPEKKEIFDQWYTYDKKEREMKSLKQTDREFKKMFAQKEKEKSEEKEKPEDDDFEKEFSELDDEEDEESIISYMTEQFTRDQRTNPRGWFQERGYKKFTNYNHWLESNK